MKYPSVCVTQLSKLRLITWGDVTVDSVIMRVCVTVTGWSVIKWHSIYMTLV